MLQYWRLTRRLTTAGALLCAVLTGALAHADVVIPAGATINLAGGGLDLACTDLIVAGTLVTGSGPINNVRNVVIQSGGVLDAGASTLNVGGDWFNNGSFIAGTSQVNFIDACSSTSMINGNTTFNGLAFASSVGKTWTFASGSTQTLQQLTIKGAAGLPLQLRSSAPGQIAFINLTGSQSVAHVGVTDLTASGLWLAPYLVNQGGSNASRWFGEPDYARVPALSESALMILLLLIGAIAARTLWSRQRSA